MGLFRLIALFFVLSGLVHIFAIAAVPFFADNKAFQRVASKAQPRTFVPLKDHAEAIEILTIADPAMAYGICHFNLINGPVSVTSEGPTEFWNVTIFNDQAETIYSLHDDVSQSNQLDLEIKLRTFTAEIDETDEKTEDVSTVAADSIEDNKIRVSLDKGDLFLVFKIFRASKHHAGIIQETLESARCQ